MVHLAVLRHIYQYKRLFKKSAFDHEVNQEVGSASNLEFSRS
ncbi:MAG: hypothetical protein ACQEXX_10195 [Bacillota bacterium]